MKVNKSFFQIGIFDPMEDVSWPWHFEYERGVYLSLNYRKCGWNKSVEFETPDEARDFYHRWKHSGRYKMELIEVKRWVEQPDPDFPPEHPRSIIKLIASKEKSIYLRTAASWFAGEDISAYMTRKTLLRHKRVLLNYGIDIEEKCTNKLTPITSIENDWQLTQPKLKILT